MKKQGGEKQCQQAKTRHVYALFRLHRAIVQRRYYGTSISMLFFVVSVTLPSSTSRGFGPDKGKRKVFLNIDVRTTPKLPNQPPKQDLNLCLDCTFSCWERGYPFHEAGGQEDLKSGALM